MEGWEKKKKGLCVVQHHELTNLHRGQKEQGQEDKSTSDETSEGRPDAALELDSRARERSSDSIGTKEGGSDVGESKSKQLLVGVDLITVLSGKGLSDSNMFQNDSERDGKQLGGNLGEDIRSDGGDSWLGETGGNRLQNREFENSVTLGISRGIIVDSIRKGSGQDSDDEEAGDFDELDRKPAASPAVDGEADGNEEEEGDKAKDEIQPRQGADSLEHLDDDVVDWGAVVDVGHSEPFGDLLDDNGCSSSGSVADEDGGGEEVENDSETKDTEDHGECTDTEARDGSNSGGRHASGKFSHEFTSNERDNGSGSDGQILGSSHEAVEDGTNVSRVKTMLDLETSDLGIRHSLRNDDQTDSNTGNGISERPVTVVFGQPVVICYIKGEEGC